MKLAPHFSLAEMTRSDVAERRPDLKILQERPSAEVIGRLTYLCETVLEPLRLLVGYPIRITSGFRCLEVNRQVGGSATSQHVLGEAADVEIDDAWLQTPHGVQLQVEAIAAFGEAARGWSANGILFATVACRLEHFDVDQVIHEFGAGIGHPAWVHVAASTRQNRRRVTFVGRYTGHLYKDATIEEALRALAPAA